MVSQLFSEGSHSDTTLTNNQVVIIHPASPVAPKPTPILPLLNYDLLFIIGFNVLIYSVISHFLAVFMSILSNLHDYLLIYLSICNYLFFKKNKQMYDIFTYCYLIFRNSNFK